MSTVEVEKTPQALGYSKSEWLLFMCDALFFYMLLLWPAVKAVNTLNKAKGKGLGGTSVYWIGVAPVYGLYCFLRFIFRRYVIFGFAEVAAGMILSYNDGSLVKIISQRIVGRLYHRYAGFFQAMPAVGSSAVKWVFGAPFKFITYYFNNSAKEE